MTGAEQGWLLLCSHLGNPARRVLTPAQVRVLARRVQLLEGDGSDRELTQKDLLSLGYGREMAQRMLQLLEDTQLMEHYCRLGRKKGCFPLTRVSPGYPPRLRRCLGEETSGCLWYQGDASLLCQPAVALVGSRDLLPENQAFAAEVGRQAARQGYVLVSGNARGADRCAQHACLEAGGAVVAVVADALAEKTPRERLLYVSEDGFDAPFSAQRAISRNRVIHALADMTFVAQSRDHIGGTWAGTACNLRHNWSPVFCCDDGSAAVAQLVQLGATAISPAQLKDIQALPRQEAGFL